MRKFPLNSAFMIFGAAIFQSCCPTASVAPVSCGVQVATTETHTKSVQPLSYSAPYPYVQAPAQCSYQAYAPSPCSYQSFSPVQLSPIQAPACQLQAAPCSVQAPAYQTVQYVNPYPVSASQCSPYQASAPYYAPDLCAPVRYAPYPAQYAIPARAPHPQSYQPNYSNQPLRGSDDCDNAAP
jgi:hypothetical protein